MDFKDFIHHDEEKVRQAAQLLAEAKLEMEAGNITHEQFEELAEDILEIGEVNDLVDSLERKLAIEKAFSIFKLIMRAIPK